MPNLKVLHAGCGQEPLPAWLSGEEVRLDIDPGVFPDIVAPLTDLGEIGKYHAIYCSHTLEHLYPHQVKKALSEFKRVLHDGGIVIIIVPDLENVSPDDTVIYVSPAGPITGLDMYYGKTEFVETNEYMSHKTGFTSKTLRKALEGAGFEVVSCDGKNSFNILALGRA